MTQAGLKSPIQLLVVLSGKSDQAPDPRKLCLSRAPGTRFPQSNGPETGEPGGGRARL